MSFKIDKTRIKPYGDTLNDGRMQLSFSLPVSNDETGKEAAKLLLRTMGFDNIEICYQHDLHEGFTQFVAYADTSVAIDITKIQVKTVDTTVMDMHETDDFIEKNIGRKIVVVGACIESDAHTVGIDAIMNMKGYSGRYGLERYKYIDAYNLGASVPCEELLKRARELKADAILVSQIVTQKDIHIANLTKLIELAESEGLRDQMLFICGGPRLNHELAIELGFDAGFGSGTYSTNVASFLATEIEKRTQK
jgi:beta-lysine 5,6-aminomutase beta subunit